MKPGKEAIAFLIYNNSAGSNNLANLEVTHLRMQLALEFTSLTRNVWLRLLPLLFS